MLKIRKVDIWMYIRYDRATYIANRSIAALPVYVYRLIQFMTLDFDAFIVNNIATA